jgi:hypothetical protein
MSPPRVSLFLSGCGRVPLTLLYIFCIFILQSQSVCPIKEGVFMPHQQPKSVEQQSYSYALRHKTAFLIQALAEQEAQSLRLQRLSPPAYLDRLIAIEAEKRLSSEKIQEAEREAQARTERRLQSVQKKEKGEVQVP